MTDELAAADPEIAAARRRGASDAELTPLYEARYATLRRHVMLDLADPSEADEFEDEVRALHTVPSPAADDITIEDGDVLAGEVAR